MPEGLNVLSLVTCDKNEFSLSCVKGTFLLILS